MIRNLCGVAGVGMLLVGSPVTATVQQAGRASAREKAASALTNADVLKMLKGGLGESIVVAAIRGAKKTAFDLSPDSLIQLKAEGVSDAVIAVMLDPSATAPAPPAAVPPPPAPVASATPDPNDPAAPHDPGIYADVGADTPRLVALEPAVFSQGKSGGLFTTALTGGIKKAKWKAVVRSGRANQRLTNRQPNFYFYFEQRGSGLSHTGGFGALAGGASSPNEFVLARMTAKEKERELIVGQFGAFGASSGTRSKDTVEMRIEKLSPGTYRVSPAEPLAPGEYCFFYAAGGSVMGMGGGQMGKLFDFGVDAAVASAKD